MASITQTYQTDALQEHPDSMQILIDRLHNWKRTLTYLETYVNHLIQAQSSASSFLEKARKSLADEPQFAGSRASGTTIADGPRGLLLGFSELQQRHEQILLESDSAAQSLKSVVLQSLESTRSELDKQYKNIKSDGHKGMKEVEKSREQTQKLVERLAKFTASFGTSKLDSKDDPYVLHRRILSAVSEQVNAENVQAESALGIQNQFSSLERHIISTIQMAIAKVSEVYSKYGTALTTHSNAINQSFASIDPAKEWSEFAQANSSVLVPSENFRRDPNNVVFTNSDHSSTRPIIEGPLRRKGTVMKTYNTGYYVLTPAGFLHQFKSQEAIADPSPELSLYLPEGQLGPLPSRASGELTFKLVAKDPSKALSRSHKYTFKGSSYDDLELWHIALTKVVGGHSPEDHDISKEDTPDVSPVTPTGSMFPSPPNNASTAAPSSGVPAASPTPAAAQPSGQTEAATSEAKTAAHLASLSLNK